MRKTFTVLLFVLLAGITPLAKAQDKAAAINSMILQANKLGLFNGNVLVVDNGKEVYRKAIGYADASKQTLLTDEYRFHIGSIAKEFNATAIMMLQEQGKLNIDDKISKYLPGLPAWANTVSIKHLLQYSSGLPDLNFKYIKTDAAAMDSVKAIRKLDAEAGTHYAYNNTSTFLQRQIVEQITGMSFNQFVAQKMLRPLGMNASLVDPGEDAPLVARSFNDNFVQSPMAVPISGWTATTLDDFYKWQLGIQQFKLIGPASTQIILTPFAPGKQCGLGGGSMANGKLISHTHDGTSLNYQALLTANTTQGRTVILLTNNKQNNLYDIKTAIQNILDDKPYRQPKKMVMTALQDKLNTATGSQLLAAYQDLRSKHPQEYDLDDEAALNSVGYTLLNKKRVDEAIVIFEYNTTLFPTSGNVFDSLGEAYYNKGDKARSLAAYKRSLALDPTNTGAKEKIAELEK